MGENHKHPYRDLFSKISQEADVLALCGDLTNFGKTPRGRDPGRGPDGLLDPRRGRARQPRL
ncbi:hypothetical protein LRS10_19505 [Phenylobacterium sp. J426]|uniref:hypothetical protein n=1 Tax=Phenylobacterium sp. J426 TaxID=2898439 RepID=UPI002151074F|nr:hypothetical protein [Phenylobacterium sp. J426]MCR5876137.1 hypothetical protein [Phenylobacterium sp. J426]